MERFSLPVEIVKLPGGGFLAACPILEGCHAEGRTVGEATENMEDVARAIIEMKSPLAVVAHRHTSPARVRGRCPVL